MKYPNLRLATAAILTLSVLIVSACSPSYVNRQNLGTPATIAEITEYHSGSYFGDDTSGAYYSSDGTYRGIGYDGDPFIGTWEAKKNGLGSTFLFTDTTHYWVKDGKTVSGKLSAAYVVYLQPDGSAVFDKMGGGNYGVPAPSRQFRTESKFNALRKKLGI